MTERKMCKFYNLNVPERSLKEGSGTERVREREREESEDTDLTPEQLAPIVVPEGHHKLQYNYWLWFSRRPTVGARNNYRQALRLVGRCGSVEQWWGLYSHTARPGELPPHSDLHLFKLGIKPMWEDEANVKGGKWVVRLRKGLAGRAWEDLCMAILGEQFMVGAELCGAVVSIRFQEDHLAIWHRTADDSATVSRVRDTLRRVLHLPPSVQLEYKAHSECLRATNEPRTIGNSSQNSTTSKTAS